MFSPACVQMDKGDCCHNKACPRTYADYGSYLKKRRCVVPSDMCNLEQRIKEGQDPRLCTICDLLRDKSPCGPKGQRLWPRRRAYDCLRL